MLRRNFWNGSVHSFVIRSLTLAVILFGLSGFIPMRNIQASTLQSASLDLVSPASCPTGGCAAG